LLHKWVVAYQMCTWVCVLGVQATLYSQGHCANFDGQYVTVTTIYGEISENKT